MTRMYLMTRSYRYEKAAAGWYSCRGFIIGLEAGYKPALTWL